MYVPTASSAVFNRGRHASRNVAGLSVLVYNYISRYITGLQSMVTSRKWVMRRET